MGFFEGLNQAIVEQIEQLKYKPEPYIVPLAVWERKWARGDKPEFFKMLELDLHPRTVDDYEEYHQRLLELTYEGRIKSR